MSFYEISTAAVSTHFFLHKMLGYESVIPTQLLNSRWLFRQCGQSQRWRFEESNPTWDSNRKFRVVNMIATAISKQLSSHGMREFKVVKKTLQNVLEKYRHGPFKFGAGSTK
ncbi:hypothetical protein PHMEG_00031429 [Phytophthora megakarya]|uniref:Uncharacterized protein n=1 Tax=Phytophthora megakarya TaxID=4795 RepID=A0A225UY43_9STRA|nr:hypothetical protein PHMEG_00031429 [Phytophthora megakarya]